VFQEHGFKLDVPGLVIKVVGPSATLHIHSTLCPWLPQFCANSQLAFQLIFKGLNHSELQQTYEQLIVQNAALKSRVTKLEVINKLFQKTETHPILECNFIGPLLSKRQA
jgi:hypothetical protein